MIFNVLFWSYGYRWKEGNKIGKIIKEVVLFIWFFELVFSYFNVLWNVFSEYMFYKIMLIFMFCKMIIYFDLIICIYIVFVKVKVVKYY